MALEGDLLKWDILHCAAWVVTCNPFPEDRLDPEYMSDRELILANTANSPHSVNWIEARERFGRTRPFRRAVSVAKEFYEEYIQNDPAARKSVLWEPYAGWVQMRDARAERMKHEAMWREVFQKENQKQTKKKK